jgi:hypothetical protein
MSKIFCGAGPIPKGYRKGTMRECIEKNQIRLFGLNKVDNKLFEKTKEGLKEKTVIPETREKLLLEMVTLRGLIKRHKGIAETSKDKEKRIESQKILEKSEQKLKKILPKLKKLEDLRENEKQKEKSKKKATKAEPKKKEKVVKVTKKK